jgi:hypothetical protein
MARAARAVLRLDQRSHGSERTRLTARLTELSQV